MLRKMNGNRNWPEHLDPIVEEFSSCFDSMERYELLFQYAKRILLPYRLMNGILVIKSMAANPEPILSVDSIKKGK